MAYTCCVMAKLSARLLSLGCGCHRLRPVVVGRVQGEVAGHEVPVAPVSELGFFQRTLLLGERAARAEAAPAGWVDRRGDVALQRDRSSSDARLRIKPRNGVEQGPGVGVAGRPGETLHRAEVRQLPKVHDGDTGAYLLHSNQVVGCEGVVKDRSYPEDLNQ